MTRPPGVSGAVRRPMPTGAWTAEWNDHPSHTVHGRNTIRVDATLRARHDDALLEPAVACGTYTVSSEGPDRVTAFCGRPQGHPTALGTREDDDFASSGGPEGRNHRPRMQPADRDQPELLLRLPDRFAIKHTHGDTNITAELSLDRAGAELLYEALGNALDWRLPLGPLTDADQHLEEPGLL